jgi:GcrA cell cycle regulator
MKPTFEWTIYRLKQLDTLWREGMPTKEIAKVIGTTKGSVIGKANRLHLPSRAIPKELQNPHGIAYRKVVNKVKIKPSKWATKAHNPKQLIDLKPNECRWPIGEPGEEGFCYCGGKREIKSYCKEHAEIAYVSLKRIKQTKYRV